MVWGLLLWFSRVGGNAQAKGINTMKSQKQKPQGGRKANVPSMSEPANRKGGNPASAGVSIQKRSEAFVSIPKSKRIDGSFGERKAAGTGARMNVKSRTTRQRGKK